MSDKLIFAIAICVAACALFVFGFGIGVAYGREEYKNELHKQMAEQNKLLKEHVALLNKLKEVCYE